MRRLERRLVVRRGRRTDRRAAAEPHGSSPAGGAEPHGSSATGRRRPTAATAAEPPPPLPPLRATLLTFAVA